MGGGHIRVVVCADSVRVKEVVVTFSAWTWDPITQAYVFGLFAGLVTWGPALYFGGRYHEARRYSLWKRMRRKP
jgi:hypothetical protein